MGTEIATGAAGVLGAIYGRRAVRAYTARRVGNELVERLLGAAVQAPSAVNQQPWGFVVVQELALLRRYSDLAKAAYGTPGEDGRGLLGMMADPGFNVFYNAGTLIVICAGPGMLAPNEDCCLAGENLMLAAYALGLGTCPIGLARPMLNTPEVKAELKIPEEFSAVLPIIVGYPAGETEPVARREPRVFSWKGA